jgi:F-type H+-transporting ATPase subunit delta
VSVSVTARTYASVLLDIGREKGLLDVFSEELAAFNECVRSENDFSVFLELPGVDLEKKKHFIEKVFSGKTSSEFIDFICVLIDNGRNNELEQIEEAYSELMDDEKKSIRVNMTTGVAIDQTVRDSAAAMLSKKFGKNVILEERVDPSIIGGIVLRAGDTIIDGSVSTRIRKLKEKLLLTTIKGEAVYEDKD